MASGARTRGRMALAVAAVGVGVATWLSTSAHGQRMVRLEEDRALLRASVTGERAAAERARAGQRSCRTRRVAAKLWGASLIADRRALGSVVVAALRSNGLRVVELRAADSAIVASAPAVYVRWRGGYVGTLGALAALGDPRHAARIESLQLKRVDASDDEPLGGESVIAAGWLPDVSEDFAP